MTAFRLSVPLLLALLPAAANAAPAEVRAAVNLRMGPGPGYQAIAVLPQGTPVEVYECLPQGGWCDVGYGDIRGWMSSRQLGSVRSIDRPILRPPVFEPPPIYREPPVYVTPPPVYRQQMPSYGWGPAPADPGYIEPPPGYVYRPPVVVAPPIPAPDEAYPVRPPAAWPAARPPEVASTPPATTTKPSASVTGTPPASQPSTASPPASTPPAATKPPPTSAASSAPTPAAPKYGSAVGKPGAPCKWVNGVCRND